jgi:hypothetical protein
MLDAHIIPQATEQGYMHNKHIRSFDRWSLSAEKETLITMGEHANTRNYKVPLYLSMHVWRSRRHDSTRTRAMLTTCRLTLAPF